MNFLIKESCSTVITLEKEWEDLDPTVIINHVAPTWGWIPKENVKKTKKFYQMIIIDTVSTEIYREVNKNDPSKTIYSKLKINRVLSYKDWNQSPLTEKRFSRVFDPPAYNYFDYQNTWYRIMCDPNPMHSWYISFKIP